MASKILFAAFATILSLPTLCYAKLPHYGTVSNISVGFVYASLLERRGVVQYRDYQILPSFSAFFFDDKLEFLAGDSIGYRDFIYENKIRLRSRIASINDQPTFPNINSVREGMPERKASYEWQNSLEFFFPAYDETYISELDLTYHKDISIHHGDYLDVLAKFKLGSFIFPGLKMLSEPNLMLSFGIGDSRHNQYFYGPSDTAKGINNVSAGVWFAFPEEADRWYPVIQVYAFEAIGDHGKAEFSTGRNRGVMFSFIATTGIW